MVRPSGLVVVEFLLSRMTCLICAVVKMSVSWSSGCCLRICLISLGVRGVGNWLCELSAEMCGYFLWVVL